MREIEKKSIDKKEGTKKDNKWKGIRKKKLDLITLLISLQLLIILMSITNQ